MAIMDPLARAKQRSQNAVGNFSFSVAIHSLTGGETPILRLPADAVRGLGDGRTTVIRHRSAGTSPAVTTPYPGISTPDAVTIEGSFLFDAEDISVLQAWRRQVQGLKYEIGETAKIAGYFRNITITPFSSDVDANGADAGKITAGAFRLNKAWATRLSFSDFDVNAPAICNWSLEVEYSTMDILEP